MKYFTATLQSAADIIRLIITGTVTRVSLAIALIAFDPGCWILALSWIARELC